MSGSYRIVFRIAKTLSGLHMCKCSSIHIIIHYWCSFIWRYSWRWWTRWWRGFTSGYPRSDPIRLNNFSLALSLIGFFLYGLLGQIFFVPGLSQDKTYRVANVPIVGLFWVGHLIWTGPVLLAQGIWLGPGQMILAQAIPLVVCYMSLGVWDWSLKMVCATYVMWLTPLTLFWEGGKPSPICPLFD